MTDKERPSSFKVFLLLVIPQAVLFLMVGANVNSLISVLLVMALLWWQSDFSEQNHIRFSIITATILFIVYHFTYGFYLYHHDKNREKVCGVFSKYDTKHDFKSSREVLVLYQEVESKFYEFGYVHRLHENTDYFKTIYQPSEKICIHYVKLPILTMNYPYLLKSVERVKTDIPKN